MSFVKANRVADFESMKSPGDFKLDILRPPENLRQLTNEEQERHAGRGYEAFESYTDDSSSVIGKFWTQQELDAIARGPVVTGLTFRCPCGCGSIGGIHFAVYDARWTWDGNEDAPTCTPSIQRGDGCKWHGHLTNGIFVPCL